MKLKKREVWRFRLRKIGPRRRLVELSLREELSRGFAGTADPTFYFRKYENGNI